MAKIDISKLSLRVDYSEYSALSRPTTGAEIEEIFSNGDWRSLFEQAPT